MGNWGPGPFDNDDAADFLAGLGSSPARGVQRALERALSAQDLDIDVGGAGWAACELVALSFGHGDLSQLGDPVLALVGKLRPQEAQRTLALAVLPRLLDPGLSELAALRADPLFDAILDDLRARLEAAGAGPRELPKPKKGDVIGLPLAGGLFVVQVLGPGELAVFEGVHPDEAAALQSMASAPARRVPAWVNGIFCRGKVLGSAPVRKELVKKKLYADETGQFVWYAVSTASGGGLQIVPYEEACQHERLRVHDVAALGQVARGGAPIERVRSVDEREAELRAREAAKWAARRAVTHPGPFGDPVGLQSLLDWIAQTGVDNVVHRMVDLAEGRQGYGRPNERSERQPYAFAGLVAVWRGGWPPSAWPSTHTLPDAPELDEAVRAARVLAAQIVTRDAELRLMWDTQLDPWVSSLRTALA
jgi:hypothetical protein